MRLISAASATFGCLASSVWIAAVRCAVSRRHSYSLCNGVTRAGLLDCPVAVIGEASSPRAAVLPSARIRPPLDGHETIVIEIDERPGALHVLWSEHFEAFGVLVDRGSPPRFEPNSTCVLLPDHVHQLGLRELVHFAFADIQFQPLQKNSEFAGHLDAVLGQAILPVVFGGFYRSSPSDPPRFSLLNF
ncbi:MAG: hypothetical protein QOD67_2020 [Caballeronia sp.]|jgi:hypothetical protein|nr:hypothetical protein [Caballeronia sp.]